MPWVTGSSLFLLPSQAAFKKPKSPRPEEDGGSGTSLPAPLPSPRPSPLLTPPAPAYVAPVKNVKSSYDYCSGDAYYSSEDEAPLEESDSDDGAFTGKRFSSADMAKRKKRSKKKKKKKPSRAVTEKEKEKQTRREERERKRREKAQAESILIPLVESEGEEEKGDPAVRAPRAKGAGRRRRGSMMTCKTHVDLTIMRVAGSATSAMRKPQIFKRVRNDEA
jgi:hypothetical protein